jgi:hypothetical protein
MLHFSCRCYQQILLDWIEVTAAVDFFLNALSRIFRILNAELYAVDGFFEFRIFERTAVSSAVLIYSTDSTGYTSDIIATTDEDDIR